MSATRNEHILKEFGKNLRKIRTKRKISLRKLEALADVDHSEIHRLEKGMRNPSLTVIIALAKALEVQLDELIPFR
jgi:transcriptional regulator with XRE-family HTH domain